MKKHGMMLGVFLISAFLTFPVYAAEDTGASSEKILPEKSASEKAPEASASEKMEETATGKPSMMEKADALVETKELDKIKQAISIYEEILKNNPDSYEATSRCAKAYRDYGYQAMQKQVSGYEDICAEYGKTGMNLAQKAIKLNPQRSEGYYYYGLSVGVYSDGVGIFTALKEGLKDKTQNNLEKAYAIDKSLDKGGPILGLGRFWQKVPWPYHDEDKAMEYYRELMDKEYFGGHVEHYIYPAEILMDKWGSKPKKEARALLKKAINCPHASPYWKNHARQLLEDL